MVFTHEQKVETNTDAQTISVYEYEDKHIKKGECMGYFKMGSTVLLFWEKESVILEPLENQKVRFSQVIAKV
jgi:phosphatidylserine decarboxylase